MNSGLHTMKMKRAPNRILRADHAGLRTRRLKILGLLFMLATLQWVPAHAALFKGEALDKAADVITWVVLIVAPVIAIGVFWIVHILPEKIAEKRKHPQAKAIQTLCMLSLVFGGILWPLAWLWAYSKPVLYKLAYGTDTVEHGHDDTGKPAEGTAEAEELKRLRAQVAELETRLAGKSSAGGERV
jgi:CBS domain containing-hemolysin-like protein